MIQEIPHTNPEPVFIYKCQPKYLEEFVMDEELLSAFKTFIQMNSMNVLLYGSPGSGKSAISLAMIRNYYGFSTKHSIIGNENILFINNLKDQGINYYRTEVKTFCQSASTIQGKKKVIVLDDMDTMNEACQQVFRNCIDKYSHNVNFIATCTSVQKIIECIQSRLYIVQLPDPKRETLNTILERIILSENMRFAANPNDETKEFLLDISKNSIRVMIHYLEKMILMGCDTVIDTKIVEQCCTNIGFHTFSKYTAAVKRGRVAEAVSTIFQIYDTGYSVMDVLDNYFVYVKMTDELTEGEKYIAIQLLCKYIAVFYNIHEDENELAFFTNSLVKALKVW